MKEEESKAREAAAERIYNQILHKKIEPMVGKYSTYLSDLTKAGNRIFGVKFRGVFPSDRIPRLNDLTPYAILNLDNSKQSGSHWIAIAIFVYSSCNLPFSFKYLGFDDVFSTFENCKISISKSFINFIPCLEILYKSKFGGGSAQPIVN